MRERRRRPRRRRLLRRLPRDHRRQPVPRPRAAARGHAQAAEGDRRGGRRRPRARPGGDLDRRAAAPQAPARRRRPRWRRAVAILGEGAPARAPPPSSPGSTPPTAEEALDALCRADVLTRDGTTGSASCTRSCARRSTPTSRSTPAPTATHRAARLLAEHGAAEEIASHIARTAPRADAWAVEALRAAAAARARPRRSRDRRRLPRARPGGAAAGAATRAAVLTELARAETQSGRPAAEEHFRAAMRLAGDRARARPDRRSGSPAALKFRGDSPARDRRRSATRSPSSTPRPAGRGARARAGRPRPTSRLAARPLLAAEIAAHRGARQPSPPRLDRLHLMASAFETAIAAGPARASPRSYARRAIAGADVPTDVSAGGHVFITAATVLVWSERYEEAERAYDKAVADARRRGSSVGFAAASSLRSRLHYRLGRLSEAEADADRRARPARRRPGLAGLPRGRAQRARVHPPRARRGRSASCSRSSTTSSPPSPPRPCRTAWRSTPAAGCGRRSATPRAGWRSCWPAASASSDGASARRRSSPGARRRPRSASRSAGSTRRAR